MKPRADLSTSLGLAITTPSPSPAPSAYGAPGLILAQKYALVREIGRGGMGVVWLAERLGWDAPVAVKMMALPDTPIARERFEREVRLAALLRSPHVVQVLDHGVDEQTRSPYLVMELLEGESLAHRQRRLGKLSPGEVLTIVSQLERALTKAHALDIGHRDLKPDNIFLVPNGNEIIVKILDFGVAKSFDLGLLDTQAVTVPGNTVGTPWYMSPEQLRGASSDPRGDLWSLAVMVCECLTGHRPFLAPDLAMLTLLLWSEHRPVPSKLGVVPPGFDEWFAKATDRDIDGRFQSAAELLTALRPICQGSSEDIPPLFSTRHALPSASVPPVFNTSVAQLSPRPKGLLLGLLAGLTLGLGAASVYVAQQSVPACAPTTARMAAAAPPAAPPPIEVAASALPPAAAPVREASGSGSAAPTPSSAPQPERASSTARSSSGRKPQTKRPASKSRSKPVPPSAQLAPGESPIEVPTRQEL